MTDLEREATPRAVEFVPFPEAAPLSPLGATPLEDDAAPPTPWLVPGVILLVLGIAVVAAVATLSGGRDDRGAGVGDRTVTVPEVSVPDGPRPVSDGVETTVPATTAPATTAPATTAPATTVPATTVPATTTPPTTVEARSESSPVTLPDGWVQFVASDQGFRVELPASPKESSERVTTSSGTATRVERTVKVPGGTIGIGSVARPDVDQDPDRFLETVARSAAEQLRGKLEIGAAGAVSAGRSLDFVVDYRGGRLRARAVYADGRLHLVTATGDATVDEAFERVRATFTPE